MEEALRAAARADFAGLAQGPDEALDLGLAAALMAAEEQPGHDAAITMAALDALASGLHIPGGDAPIQKVARLNHYLFVEHGFHGSREDYSDPGNSFLDQVLQRRTGLPILLSLLMIEVGRRVGVEIDGIGFPGHFIVRPRDVDPVFYVDPFHEGRILRQDVIELKLQDVMGVGVGAAQAGAALAPVNSRQILIRMNRNLKNSYMERRDVNGILRACERLLLLDPGLLEERRDRALLLGRLGRFDTAIAELSAWIERYPDRPETDELKKHLGKLKARKRMAEE